MQTILVVATRQIGDVLLTTPLIHAARLRWPNAAIDVIGLAGTLGMLKGNPDIRELITTQPSKGWRDTAAVLRKVWKAYDLALVTQPSDRAHLIGWAASRCRSGVIPAHNSSNWWKRRILRHVVISQGDEGTEHVVTEKMALLAPWHPDGFRAVLVQAPPAQPLPAELEAMLGPKPIVVHAPSMWPYKQWPIHYFHQLLTQLLQSGHQVVLTGSGGDTDQDCVRQLKGISKAPQLIDTSGQLNFNQLTALFQHAALYVGPDTSVTHLAAAAGVPVLALFGPTNPLRWGPWPFSPQTDETFSYRGMEQTVHTITVLQSAMPCVPCSKAGCENHTQSRSDCLWDISPDRVFRVIQKLLVK